MKVMKQGWNIKTRVAGAGAALFGWSRNRFFGPGPAPAPTPTLLQIQFF